jgi:hypothetical protein
LLVCAHIGGLFKTIAAAASNRICFLFIILSFLGLDLPKLMRKLNAKRKTLNFSEKFKGPL